MPLSVCKREHTHREYLTWVVWLNEQWNVPTKDNLYSMQIAAEVRRVLSKQPNAIKTEHFKMVFEHKKEPTQEQLAKSRAQALQRSKAAWASRVGFKKA